MKRRDPEILFAGEQESLTARIEGGERRIVHAAHKTDGRPGNAFQALSLRAIPRNDKPPPGTGTRLHRQIHTLVAHQFAEAEIVAAGLWGAGDTLKARLGAGS